jgi:leucyl aminopeptidase (aminopeptidase T)
MLLPAAEKHLRDILTFAFEHTPDRAAMVVYDARSELSRLITEAYRRCLPAARFIDFDQVPAESIRTAFDPLRPADLVVLVQSTNFRLETFRIRVELFKRGLKVIEHPHLERMTGVEAEWYVDALAYDPAYYRGVGAALRERIDKASGGVVDSGGERLVFASPFEPAKLNVGDYRGMKNTGGQFPIGEVFTEARDLEAVSGRMRIFIFADIDFMVNRPEKPITLVIEKGRVTGAIDSTPEFERVLARIREDEGEVRVRELGFGMNRAFSPERMVRDIGTLERMCGIHLSLGAKHAVYDKPDFRRRHGKHHVDVFAVTESVTLDGETVFRNGAWFG